MKHNGGQHNEARKPDEILAEIERTRHDMDSTLSAIENRLTPGQLFDQGVEYLRHSGGHEFVQNLGTQAKNNPMPIALVGIGLAWLMASGKNPPARYSYESTSYGPSVGERASELGNKASGMASSAKDRISGTTQAVGDRMRQARESLTSTGQSARQRVSDLSDSARQQMDRARSGMDYMMREQPLALGAIGLAIGAIVAAMAPRTRKEDELMGDTRDRMLDQAKEAGKEKLEQAKEVANTAVGAATKEAESRGLKPQGGTSDWNKPGAKPSVTPKPGPATATSGSPMPSTSIGPSGGSGNLP
jgi:hypothetical protein